MPVKGQNRGLKPFAQQRKISDPWFWLRDDDRKVARASVIDSIPAVMNRECLCIYIFVWVLVLKIKHHDLHERWTRVIFGFRILTGM